MTSIHRTHRRVAGAAAWVLAAGTAFIVCAPFLGAVDHASAAERRGKAPRFGEFNPADESVELFAAMDAGQIDVKLIPRDSTQANVIITNKSGKPLNVKLPRAFAGVPVLAQLGGGLGAGPGLGGGGGRGIGGGGGGFGGGGGQGIGGGMGGGGMGGGMGGGGMGMFNVPAEKVGKFKVACMCLEHGKEEPRASIPYQIVPLDKLTTKPEVHELCRMLGEGQVNQRAAQAAAWNLNNDMSWEKLAAKRIERADGSSYPYFTQQELRAATAIAGQAVGAAKERASEAKSPGEVSAASDDAQPEAAQTDTDPPRRVSAIRRRAR